MTHAHAPLTPTGEELRQPPQKITARAPGHMVHLDVKKIGKIPDGGGPRAHGRGTEAARAVRAVRAAKHGPGAKVGYTSLHSAIDGHTRLAYTEALEDERPAAVNAAIPINECVPCRRPPARTRP